MQDAQQGIRLFKEKASRLLEFLREITRLRSKLFRDLRDYKSISEYNSILWINDIPRGENQCFARAWGFDLEDDPDIWIEIKKYPEPELDGLPKVCAEWVDEQALKNVEEIPSLHNSIEIEERTPDPENPDSYILRKKEIHLSDYPEVIAEWDRFIEEKWFPWTTKFQLWQAVQNAYQKLFSIYQLQQKLGERFELVIGIGLLSWKLPSGQNVNRHILTARADLSFEARLGKFTVKPALDKPDIRLEFDMIDPEFQPITLKQTAQNLVFPSNDPWEKNTVDLALTSLANSISHAADGIYMAGELAPVLDKCGSRPEIRFAPALFLRERAERDLEQRIDEILGLLDQEHLVPPEFMDLCDLLPDRSTYLEEVRKSRLTEDSMVYFPKPSNEEQRQILGRLDQTTGILVQGPPGTGKSHTIANLICHLLATGQRVLVTAKTPRALRVLHKLLPEKLQPLCVILLGNSVEEQKELETSVVQILNEQDRWNELAASSEITESTQKIRDLQKEKQEFQFRLRTIKEADSKEQLVPDTPYRGTASEIARRVNLDSEQFNWLEDDIRYDAKLPITIEDLRRLITLLRTFTPEEIAELRKTIPVPGISIPPVEDIEKISRSGRELAEKCKKNAELINSPFGQALSHITDDKICLIQEAVGDLISQVNAIQIRGIDWEKEAVIDVLKENEGFWKEINSILSVKLQGLREKAKSIENVRIETPKNIDRKKILTDAENLKSHIDKRGKLGFGPFRPRIVQETLYLLKETTVDGHKCNSSRTLKLLIDFIGVEQTLDQCWKYWQRRAFRKSDDTLIQIAELESLQSRLSSVLGLALKLKEAKEQVYILGQIEEIHWHNIEKLEIIYKTCESIREKRAYDNFISEYKKIITKFEKCASEPNAHPITIRALEYIKAERFEEYRKLLNEINRLLERKTSLNWADSSLGFLASSAPKLVKAISQNLRDDIWSPRINTFPAAWNWGRARSWLEHYINKDDIPSIEKRIQQIEDDIKGEIEKLAAKKAWKFCFSRMTQTHRRNLIGWQMEMGKVGKRKGKHWPKHLRSAQKYLNESKDAVPAWVMPLHKVYENIQSSPGLFDVIIVDEASQCGPEALPLYFLGKKIVVVGDDQQISPESSFIDQEIIDTLIKEYLSDFRYKESFAPDYSLFAHAKWRFPSPIVLREHFRCVPEIISFSNDLCYSATPLYPLRQYPPKRLDPLVEVHVVEGYREGREGRVINYPEAERLVKQIVNCCRSQEYKGKSMGVITLQGYAQAGIIEDLLLKELAVEEIDKRQIICGDAYSFQGDERDVIFLSMVAAPNEPIGVLNKKPDIRRFNVAASRARDQVWLFHTATRNDISKLCLRWRLLEHFEAPRRQLMRKIGNEDKDISLEELKMLAHRANRIIEKPPIPFESWFEVDVAIDIASHGFRVIPQFEIAGKRIDLVVEGNKGRLAVECDGDEWHGIDEYESDMERQRKLERCQLKFHRIRESAYYGQKEKSLERLWQDLKNRGINPIIEDSDLQDQDEETQEDIWARKSNERDGKEDAKGNTDRKEEKPRPSSKPATLDSIDDAIRLNNQRLGEIIIDTLKTRPNYSCKQDALVTFVLRHMGIVSRGRPRHIFESKVLRVLYSLEQDGLVRIYKSKNIRVKLIGF
jgi:hypothetical protein